MSELTEEQLLGFLDIPSEKAESVAVEGASGTTFHVYGDEEALWFTSNLEKYLEQYRFENIADLGDLDRMLGLELLSYRWTRWMIEGVDYDGLAYDEKGVREHKNKVDQEIRHLKAHMGMSRRVRTESETESAQEYLKNLLRRAGEFGVHRDMQIAKAIDLFNELKKLYGLYQRCDEEERAALGVTLPQIFEWIGNTAIPEYDKLDAAFRKNQRLWIKEV